MDLNPEIWAFGCEIPDSKKALTPSESPLQLSARPHYSGTAPTWSFYLLVKAGSVLRRKRSPADWLSQISAGCPISQSRNWRIPFRVVTRRLFPSGPGLRVLPCHASSMVFLIRGMLHIYRRVSVVAGLMFVVILSGGLQPGFTSTVLQTWWIWVYDLPKHLIPLAIIVLFLGGGLGRGLDFYPGRKIDRRRTEGLG